MLSSIFQIILLLFASIGLVALVLRIFRTNWTFWVKAAALLGCAVFVETALKGSATGELVALCATGGVVIALNWAVRRINDRRWQAAVVVLALVVMIFTWRPYFNSSGYSIPSVPLPVAGPATPVVPQGPSMRSSPRRSATAPIVRREPTDQECTDMAPDDARELNCP